MAYRTVLVEDETPARDLLKTLLEPHRADIHIAGEAADGPAAVKLIQELEPDLVFLDVELPGKNAFQILAELAKPPAVIMTTAYSQHALQAFKTSTLDYLVKPIDPDELQNAIRKLKQFNPLPGQLMEKMKSLLNLQKEYPPGVTCKVGKQWIVVNKSDILYFQSELKYTTVVTRQGRYLIETPLIDLEESLNPAEFQRIHRGSIVNISHIAALKPLEDGKLEVILKGQSASIHASRSYSEKLKSVWI